MRATAVVQFFSMAAMLLSLVAVPLYLRWLGHERYGLLLTGMAFASYLMFADAGLSLASMLLISQANGRNDKKEITTIVRTSVSLGALSALAVCLTVIVLFFILKNPQRPAWLPTSEEAAGLVLSVGLSVVITLLLSPFYSVFMGLQEMHITALYQGVSRLLGVLASVGAAALSAPLGLVFGANVLCSLIIGFVAAVHCARRHPWAFQHGSFWDARQVHRLLRTGGKSFAQQAGGILVGTAPLMAISTFAGTAHVPHLSIPLTLLNAPLSLMNSFGASLQPGYGEAMGRDEGAWIAETIRSILSLGMVFLGLLVAGFMVLAQPFIQVWTLGKIVISPLMLLSVIFIASTGVLTGIFRFALTGMNRHRTAGYSDVACGVLSLLCCACAVYLGGYASVGLGTLAAVLLTSGWVLPADLKNALSQTVPWIQHRLVWTLLFATTVSAGAGQVIFSLMSPLRVEVASTVSGLVIVLIYAGIIRSMCRTLWLKVTLLIRQKILKQKTKTCSL